MADDRRVLDVAAAAHYLSISVRSLREFIDSGLLSPLQAPAVRGNGVMRRTLLDRVDLDRLVDSWRGGRQ